ncbi:sensor histidine kinase [Thermopolyspora sp. NPDC052614]|uniref:sensor histidine kinase n=1 Tax=Thermopolyspora sp. NPDC052614 TaxID=3155682 RepID=UPI00343518A8
MTARVPWRRRVMPVAGALLVGLDAWLAARWGGFAVLFYVKELVQVAAWLLAGFLVARLEPDNRMGDLMMLLGLLLAADAPAAFALDGSVTAVRVLVMVAMLLTALQLPLGAHVFLSYPSGAVGDRAGRIVMRAGYAFGAACVLALVVVGPAVPAGECRDVCVPISLIDRPEAALWAGRAAAIGTAAMVLIGASVIARRFVRASPRQRRVLAFPTTAMITAAGLWAAVNLAVSLIPAIGNGVVNITLAAAQSVSLLAVPAAFFLGLIRQRLDEARVSDLLRRVAEAPAGRLDSALAEALGDPHLRVAYPVGDPQVGGADRTYVDATGSPIPSPLTGDSRRMTVVGDPDKPMAVLLHDPGLRSEPALLEAVCAAARLALENVRLQAAVSAQLAEVRASRARLVAAGDEARRQIERDLHDGAQQRMLAVGLALTMLGQSLDEHATPRQTRDLLEEALTELRAATEELRELARGIHPAALSLQGLLTAVQQLALRSGTPVRLHADELPRLDPAVEATAYFLISEALTNVMRHAHATQVDIHLSLDDDRDCLTVRVRDDGVGGADLAAGSGLAGLADRVAALDGTLHLSSPPGGGTELTAELPCGW